MIRKPSLAILVLLIGISFQITSSTQAVLGAPVVNGVLGDSCPVKYISRIIFTDSSSTAKISGVCFPSINDSKFFIWSIDDNETPAHNLVVDNDDKIAFGRPCVIEGTNTCSIDESKTSRYLEDQPFVKAYPDTKHVNTLGGIWWSDTYEENIISANYTAPEKTDEREEEVRVGREVERQARTERASQAITSILLIGLVSFVSLSTSASNSSNGSVTPQPGSPDAPDLLRSRKERRFANAYRLNRFLHGSVISMDRWEFFTVKLPDLIRRVGKFSSVAATSIGDADYLRAVLGIFSILIYPAAILIGYFEFNSSTTEVSSIPSATWLIAALILGCFDSLAGAITASTFGLLSVQENLTNASVNWLTLIGTLVIIFILSTGPALFAGALRRFDGIHNNRKGRWERLVDYALSPLVTAWVVWKGLELLPKISKEEIAKWPENIDKIAVIVFICVVIRYFLEGYVAKHFTERINEIVTESIPLQKSPKILLHVRKGIWISLISYLLLVPEPVSNNIMWLILPLLLIPAITLCFGIKPTDKLAKFNIIGTPRLVFLLLASLGLNIIFTSRGIDNNTWLFVFLAFAPIFYFNLIEALTESFLRSPAYFYQTAGGRFLYRLGSILLYFFILIVIATQVGWIPW